MENSSDDDTKSCKHGVSVWYWFVVIGSVLGTILEGMIPSSIGIVIPLSTLNSNSSQFSFINEISLFQLNWVPSLSSALPCLLLPFFVFIVGKLRKFYQLHSLTGFVILAVSCGLSSLAASWDVLIFTHSLLYSLGSSLFLAVIILIAEEYFPVKHRFHVLATSLYHIGYPIAALVGNPILAALIAGYGWKVSLKLIAILQLGCGTIIASLMIPLSNRGCCNSGNHDFNETETLLTDDEKYTSPKIVDYFCTNFQIWPWMMGKFFNYACAHSLRSIVLIYLLKETTFSLTNSVSLLSMYAGAELIMALIASSVGDLLRGWLVHVHILSAILMAILMGILPLTITNFVNASVLMICIGASVQLSLSFGYPASVQVWGPFCEMKTGWIFTLVVIGLGILFGTYLRLVISHVMGISYLFRYEMYGWTMQIICFTLTVVIMKRNSYNQV